MCCRSTGRYDAPHSITAWLLRLPLACPASSPRPILLTFRKLVDIIPYLRQNAA
nr:MAG TPA: hypothetical protein [Caudoviricetes sp.]